MTDPMMAYRRHVDYKEKTVAIDEVSGIALRFVDAFPRATILITPEIPMRKRDDGVWVPVRPVSS